MHGRQEKAALLIINLSPSLAIQVIRTKSVHYAIYGLTPWARANMMALNGLGSDRVAAFEGPQNQSLRRGALPLSHDEFYCGPRLFLFS